MNVIKHGKYSYRKVCEDCGCEFEYSILEIQHKAISTAFRDDYFDVYYINCPECGEKITVNKINR